MRNFTALIIWCMWPENNILWPYFAACEDGQFMCNDQTCIEPEKKCDGQLDCANNEDEASCTTTGMH